MAVLEDKTAARFCYVCGEWLPLENRRIVFLQEKGAGAHVLVTAVHPDGDCAQRVEEGPSREWLADPWPACASSQPTGVE
jgi:hypothetical protein